MLAKRFVGISIFEWLAMKKNALCNQMADMNTGNVFFFFFNGTPSELKLQYNDLLNLQSVNQSDMQRFSNKLFKDNRSGSDPSCMLFL